MVEVERVVDLLVLVGESDAEGFEALAGGRGVLLRELDVLKVSQI